ncbi:MAG: hypothetical protein AB8B57_03960 [Congregibacter sp.]
MKPSLGISAKLALALAAVFGVLYLSIGIMWLVQPAVIAGLLGATLLKGAGLATQLGDSAAFFLCSGVFMLFGVLRRRPSFLLAGAWLVGLAAPARIIAWLGHGAVLTLEPIIVEVVTFLVVFAAARSLKSSLSATVAE